MRRSRFFFHDYWLESVVVFGEAEMSEGSQFASAMVVTVFAALMLVAGQLHIKMRPQGSRRSLPSTKSCCLCDSPHLDPDESLHLDPAPRTNPSARQSLRSTALRCAGLFLPGDIHGSIGRCATRERAA